MGKRSVVVTGASTGIGEATARVLVGKGLRVFGSVRKPADGERLKAQIGPDFEPLAFDVTNEAAVRAEAARVRGLLGGETLLGLVNNAGIAVGGPLLLLSLDELRRQFEVNVIGVVAVTQAFAPLLGADRSLKGGPGRIVNMSSVAGKLGPPFMAPYVASKHALEGLSQSLRRELLVYGIDVILIGPGAVATPIWDKAEEIDPARFAGSDFDAPLRTFVKNLIEGGRKGLPPAEVGALVHHVLTTATPKTRYPILRNRMMGWLLPTLLPDRTLDRLMGKQLGLTR